VSNLVIDELQTYLEQEIEVFYPIFIKAVRLKMFFFNTPPGTFYLRIYNGLQLVDEYSFTSALIKSQIPTTNPYFHAIIALVGDTVIPRGNIKLRLESSGYTYAVDSFIGWCKDYEKTDERFDGASEDYTTHPYEFKLIEYSERATK
jgi:hypothetical protein